MLLLTVCGMSAQQNKTMHENEYARRWEKVASLEKKSLPQSAAEEVNAILHLAVDEQNSPQVIKALIHLGKYDLARDVENDTLVFNRLQGMLEKSSDVVEKAVLHSMLGELYLHYYQVDQWQIRQRTELRGYIPSDMKEWTRNIFYDKVVEHMEASLADRKQLEAATVSTYSAVVDEGKDSRRFYPTMYDFLALRAIEQYEQLESDEDMSRTLARRELTPASLFVPADAYIHLPIDPREGEYNLMVHETRRKLMASLMERGLHESLLLEELNKLESLSRLMHETYRSHALSTLEAMLGKWQGDPFSVEIIDRIAAVHQEEIYRLPEELDSLRDERTKELYHFLQQAIENYPGYERIALLENRLRNLTTPQFSLSGNNTFPADGVKKITVTYKNLRSLTARLYRIDSPVDLQMNQSGVRQTLQNRRSFVKEIPVNLPNIPPYQQGATAMEVTLTKPGSYMLTFDSQPETNDSEQPSYFFTLSDLAVFSRLAGENLHHFFVVERVTGKPVADAEIVLYKQTGNWRNSRFTEAARIATNREGLAIYRIEDDGNNLFYHAVRGTDNGSQLTRLNNYRYFTSAIDEEPREQTDLFTDRSLYRPGQTVHYKAVLTHQADSKRSLATGSKTIVSLHDANGEKIASQEGVTNEFGSTTGAFVLPQGVLPGFFSLRTESGTVSFRVEEYKRPTFEVTFDPVEGSYRFGEEVTLRGKAVAYSGVALQNASVAYRITRQQSWWRFWGGAPEQFAEGVVTSDDQGGFEIRFTPEKSDTQQGRRSAFTFVVEATVTDLNGETQAGTYALSVGDVSMMLQLEMSERWEKEGADPILITAKNLSGSDVKATGSYQIYAVEENDSTGKQVATGDFETGPQPELKKRLARLRSGKYRVKLFSKDDRGNPVEAEKELLLFSFADKWPPLKTNDWFVVRNSTFAPGKPAEILMGATGKVHLLYELWKEETLLERQWLILDNENKRFSFPYKEEYGEGVTLLLTHVKEQQFTTHHTDLLRKEENKELKVKLDIFRDKIRPGADEEWRVTVTDEKGNPAAAELLASMYDFSLDQIYPSQSWNFPSASFLRYRSAARFSRDNSFNTVYAGGYIPVSRKEVPGFRFDRFNWHGFSFYNNQILIRGTKSLAFDETVVVGYATTQKEMSVAENDMVAGAVEEVMTVGDAAAAPPPPTPEVESLPQVRRNFSETAFFYPQLRTNEKGETQIAFTVPESNTRWRFRLLAHDRELSSGSAEAFTISQKELMVTPNMPRFLREGDHATISSKISNLSDSLLMGEVTMQLFNPLTEELISEIRIDDAVMPFTLAAGASTEVAWRFALPTGIDLLGVRIVAESEFFSDGEQHALAVLPNRMLVTESLRMDLNGSETKQFTMDRLLASSSPTAEEYRLTLEFASSPAWYAVQALPVLSDPASDNAVAWFAAYYSTSLGAYIGKSYPRVTAMVDAWQKEGGSGASLQSQLSKNEELKNLLLEETPWVLEARDESEQRQRLSLLFDLNRSRDQLARSLRRLQELQTEEGGWSWFKGFRPSVGITHYILYGLNRLQELGALQSGDETLSMQSQAVTFADAEALRRFEALKRYNKDWKKIKMISLTDLEYLYVRSAYPDNPMEKELKEMSDFYHSVLQKHWTAYGLYERSLIAVLMHRNQQKELLQAILRSYREHATLSDEMGMYWANNRAQVFMSQSATSVHTFIMDAFRLGGASADEMDKMKRWLLKQKQTQLWESTHATTDAVYTLLSSGSDWFAATGETTVTLGDKMVEPSGSAAGTGYFKESWSRSEITPAMGRVTVEHNGSGPAWGALYRQYFEEMDKVVKSDGSLDIEKKLFLEQTDESGRVLVPLTEERPLQVGDKVVVRLTLRNDRDLEFVQLKDMRAASFEPVTQLSGMAWQNGVPYYQVTKDASISFFFDQLPRGTRLFEYALYVTRAGSYSNGIATVQSLYAPEFTSHTAGMRIIVKE